MSSIQSNRSSIRTTTGFRVFAASRHLTSLAVALLFSLLAMGCGGGAEATPTGEVSGKVTVNGEPLTQGQVNFISAEKGVGGTGELQEDGTYKLDGPLPVGEYKVYISFNIAPSQLGTAAEDVLKLVPEKYQTQQTSDLSAKVEADRTEYDFAIE
ncbi:MAG: hypothetical protein KDA79_14130 [Planctomycetaceae bacterium]|nr:hypothetical protein [Planctomycetaceae bacterium]